LFLGYPLVQCVLFVSALYTVDSFFAPHSKTVQSIDLKNETTAQRMNFESNDIQTSLEHNALLNADCYLMDRLDTS
jgi:hypothetical protein